MSKKQVYVSIDDVSEDQASAEFQGKYDKWKFFFLNIKGGHPTNEHLFDNEPYTIDTLLTYEDHLRVDKANAPLWKKVAGFIWDPVFLPPQERKYVAKIDLFIFFYAILASFTKELDQTNINNAYVSGMKEDLNMYGANDYNLLTTYFNIGYMAFSIPMAVLLKYVRPSILLPLCEVSWTVIIMIMATMTTKESIFGLRLVQGIVESALFPGLALIIGEFYGKEGIGKRMFMLNATGSISGMFAGYIQAGVYTNMNGLHGLPGWKWVLLVDGFISIPIALVGFFSLPDFPQNSKGFWMSKKDRQFALARAKKMKKTKPEPLTLQNFWQILKSWKLYIFVATYVTITIGNKSGSYFALYLKSLNKYTVQQINLIPTAGSGLEFLNMFFTSAVSDYTNNRISMITYCLSLGFLSCLLLSIWDIPFGLKIFAYLLGYCGSSQTIFMSWFADKYSDEPLLKAVNIAIGNTIIYSFTAFLPLAIFKTKDAPHFPYGYQISAGFYVLGLIVAWIFWYVTKRYVASKESKEVISTLDDKTV